MQYAAVYISEAQPGAFGPDAASRREALAALQAQAARNNEALDIQGLLVCGDDFFVQWLQGEEGAVRALLTRIAADPRHRGLRLLHAGMEPPLLQTWSMAVLSRQAGDPGLAAELQALRQGTLPGHGGSSIPAAIIRRLVKPGPEVAGAPRIGVFGQSGMWTGALMAHLRERWQVPLQRTRLLGQDVHEREALVESLVHEDRALGRLGVVNYSGELIAAPWMRGCIAPLRLAVLVTGGADETTVAEHARMVLDQLQGHNSGIPLLVLLGRNAMRAQPALAALCEGAGHPVSWEQVPLADAAGLWDAVADTLARHPVPATEPQPRPASPRPAPPVASAQACLEQLLRADGVAGAAVLAPSGETLLQSSTPDVQRSLEMELQAWRSGPWPADWREDGWQWLTRWEQRLSLLRRLPDGSLLLIATQPGYINESWLRVQVDAAMHELLSPA